MTRYYRRPQVQKVSTALRCPDCIPQGPGWRNRERISCMDFVRISEVGIPLQEPLNIYPQGIRCFLYDVAALRSPIVFVARSKHCRNQRAYELEKTHLNLRRLCFELDSIANNQ